MTKPLKQLPFQTTDISDQKLGNIEIIGTPMEEVKAPVVKYAIPPEIDVIGVNAPSYDCCIQKVVDEMGRYIQSFKLQFVLGNDNSPRDIMSYFPRYVLYFRSGTIQGVGEPIIGGLIGHIPYYRSLAIPIFYYLDDYLLTMNDRAPLRIMSDCDGIIVSTNTLKDALLAEGINRPIYVMRTHMDLPTFNMLPPLAGIRDPERINIFFSSQGRIGIKTFYDIVERMDQNTEKYKNIHFVALAHEVAQVRSIINKFRTMKKTYVEWIPLEMYYRLAATMDMVLAPGAIGDLDYMMERGMQDLWLNSKSCHKYTLAGAAGIPCISAPLRDYKEAIVHGETGFIANDIDEWMKYIDLLVADKDLRETMGKNAKKDVEENWSIYKRIEQLAGILRGKDQNYSLARTVGIDRVEVTEQKVEAPNINLNKHPKVMLYIPVHNVKPYIRECLDSVVSQTYENQDVVVYDNGSDDGTAEIIENEYPTVKLTKLGKYYEKGNPGFVTAFTNSEYIFASQLGGDDKLVPNFWETVLPYFQDKKDIGFVRIGCYQFSVKNPEGSWWKPVPFTNPLDILVNNRIFISSPIRIEAWNSIQGYPMEGFIGGTDQDCFFSDWDQWIQIILKGWKWGTCNKPLFWYRRRPEAWSFNYDTDVEGPAYTYMRNKWMPTLLKYGITASSMATPQQIAEAKSTSKYAKEALIGVKE